MFASVKLYCFVSIFIVKNQLRDVPMLVRDENRMPDPASIYGG